MKKLIFVNDSLCSGGAERVLSILANKFAEIGYNVNIVSKSQNPSFYEINKEVKLVYPKAIVEYKNLTTRIISRFKLYKDIYTYLRFEKPDVVITFSTTTNGAIILICRILGLFVIASEHNNYKVKIKSLPIWFIKRHIYPLANILTVLTERDIKEYYGKFLSNVIVMPNPLSLKPALTVNIENREKIVLAVGNVSRWKHKGFDNLMKIFSLSTVNQPDWKLNIAGGGDPAYLKTIIKDLKLENQVTLLGEVKDIQRLMQKSSIFALPSRWEGLPMVLIEAMSQGMVCVAFDCYTGPAEILSPDVDGILVEDQNIEEFSKKLSLLFEDGNLRGKLGKNAIETSKRYIPEKIVSEWETLIEHQLEH